MRDAGKYKNYAKFYKVFHGISWYNWFKGYVFWSYSKLWQFIAIRVSLALKNFYDKKDAYVTN